MNEQQMVMQIMNAEKLIEDLSNMLDLKTKKEWLELHGLTDAILDKYAVMKILGVSSINTIKRYQEVGGDDYLGNKHYLPVHYPDGNKPRYKVNEVLEFKRKTIRR